MKSRENIVLALQSIAAEMCEKGSHGLKSFSILNFHSLTRVKSIKCYKWEI